MAKPSHKPYKYMLEKLRDALPSRPARVVGAGADLHGEAQVVVQIDTGIYNPPADLAPVTDTEIDPAPTETTRVCSLVSERVGVSTAFPKSSES